MQRTPPGGRGRGSVPPSSRPQSASGSANRPPSRPPHPRNNPHTSRANAALSDQSSDPSPADSANESSDPIDTDINRTSPPFNAEDHTVIHQPTGFRSTPLSSQPHPFVGIR
ncbi:hypothetical protein CROQUDRAFT_674093 [Cronartium quercuum f. sp. fusiforme G11]|uniref:Uncharacterized protein n=1 Tax=Cronartium quercuum f. sp. fusiforme G11 TaxID=708437 RepID=A0A9P6N9F7_9BASI|nr:hypothetical protein CROQUDRAFT_674093 [Cronartium quercuum f. sp. fusiforme G11]